MRRECGWRIHAEREGAREGGFRAEGKEGREGKGGGTV